MMLDLDIFIGLLRCVLPGAWCAETSSDANAWTPANPALNQCAVTACLVQDLIGGEIVWAEAQLPDGSKVSHYFNRAEGRDVDLTREQFPEGTIVPPGAPKLKGYPTTRDYVLSFPATRARYELLRSRVEMPVETAEAA